MPQAPGEEERVDRAPGELDTLLMIYAPRNMIFYAVGFVVFGAAVAMCFKLSSPADSDVDTGVNGQLLQADFLIGV